MNIKAIIGLVVYGIVCFITSILFARCSEKMAQERIQKAEIEAEQARATIYTLETENAKLHETMGKANEAVERALNLITESQKKHNERIQTIETDPGASDWLTCDLPDSVRNGFENYCKE